MQNLRHLDASIEQLLHTIADSQTPDGDFDSLSGDEYFLTNHDSKTTFHTSLILECLKEISEHATVRSISRKACKFLLRQKNMDGTWNYWQKGTKKGVPPDLDDTSCALAALSIHAKDTVDGADLATFTKHLINAETAVGGPYRTWIVPRDMRKDWPDVDIVVNANIAYFLDLHEVSLPNIEKMIEDFLTNPTIVSQYYSSPIVTLYFLARVYVGKEKGLLVKQILEHRGANGLWKNDLETALALSALIRLAKDPCEIEKEIQKAIVRLKNISAQDQISAYPLYIEEHIGVPTFSGSACLTTACILEAFVLYRTMLQKKSEMLQKEELRTVHERVLENTFKRVAHMSKEMQTDMETLVAQTISHDPKSQVTLLPYHFACAMKETQKIKTSTLSTVDKLGVANVLGWVGYRIHDNILDNEGSSDLLPLAATTLREVSLTYRDILKNESALYEKIMDEMDNANAWERKGLFIGITNNIVSFGALPSYGDYSMLAAKSFGHALGPLALLLDKGYSEDSLEVQSIKDFFRHYIIARQLNDDAHDWMSDLKRGFLNSASVLVLEDCSQRFFRKKYIKVLNLTKWEPMLRSIFWRKIILVVAKNVLDHATLAKKALANNSALKDTSYLLSILAPIENAAHKAVAERAQMLEFVASY